MNFVKIGDEMCDEVGFLVLVVIEECVGGIGYLIWNNWQVIVMKVLVFKVIFCSNWFKVIVQFFLC